MFRHITEQCGIILLSNFTILNMLDMKALTWNTMVQRIKCSIKYISNKRYFEWTLTNLRGDSTSSYLEEDVIKLDAEKQNKLNNILDILLYEDNGVKHMQSKECTILALQLAADANLVTEMCDRVRCEWDLRGIPSHLLPYNFFSVARKCKADEEFVEILRKRAEHRAPMSIVQLLMKATTGCNTSFNDFMKYYRIAGITCRNARKMLAAITGSRN